MRRVFCLVMATLSAAVLAASTPSDVQLDVVREKIRELELRLSNIAEEAQDAEQQRRRLDAQLELADVRVREVELLLEQKGEEAEALRNEAAAITAELDARRRLLDENLQITALLGRPGPLQLLYDAFNGGELEDAVGTVAVLTAGQARLVEEYVDLRRGQGERLARLSRTLEEGQEEARALEARRAELKEVRRVVAARLARLEKNRKRTGASLEDLREREAALERLIGLLAAEDRVIGNEDIRGYRGALPWPVEGQVVQGFGRHYLPKYSTYTVCNGLRFDVPSNQPVTAVFPGIVAFARHFKGYGNMVVIDHGNGVYSLVAGLATIHVRLDQRVSMGTQLGLASPPKDGGNIYLEIRVGEKPEDPRRWLQLKGGSS